MPGSPARALRSSAGWCSRRSIRSPACATTPAASAPTGCRSCSARRLVYGDELCTARGFEAVMDLLLRLGPLGVRVTEMGFVLDYGERVGTEQDEGAADHPVRRVAPARPPPRRAHDALHAAPDPRTAAEACGRPMVPRRAPRPALSGTPTTDAVKIAIVGRHPARDHQDGAGGARLHRARRALPAAPHRPALLVRDGRRLLPGAGAAGAALTTSRSARARRPTRSARSCAAWSRSSQRERPDVLLVEGDTNSVLAAGARRATSSGSRSGHVEAGLRSYDRTHARGDQPHPHRPPVRPPVRAHRPRARRSCSARASPSSASTSPATPWSTS